MLIYVYTGNNASIPIVLNIGFQVDARKYKNPRNA